MSHGGSQAFQCVSSQDFDAARAFLLSDRQLSSEHENLGSNRNCTALLINCDDLTVVDEIGFHTDVYSHHRGGFLLLIVLVGVAAIFKVCLAFRL